ncbi:hypothetical protein ACFLZH_02095 [Patescibacteria group bacterium]
MKNSENLYFAERRMVYDHERPGGGAEKNERPKEEMKKDAKAFMKKIGLNKEYGEKYLMPLSKKDRKRKTVTKVVKDKDGKPKKKTDPFGNKVNQTKKARETSKERDARVTKEVRIRRRQMCQSFLDTRLKAQGYKTHSIRDDVMEHETTGNQIDLPKYTNQLFAYLRKNRKTIIAEISKERKKAAPKKVAKKAPETKKEFKKRNFTTTYSEKKTKYFYILEFNKIQKKANAAAIRAGNNQAQLNAKVTKLKTKINKIMVPHGVKVTSMYDNFKIPLDGREFDGPKAYQNVKNRSTRTKIQTALRKVV